MREVNKVVNIPINKRCPKCDKLLPSAFFSKKTKSKDGLQDYCKSCLSQMLKQSRKNKKKRLHNNELAVLSYNAKKNGLQYHFVERKKKNDYRKNIIYKCLGCGVEVESTIKHAIENKFQCGHCEENIKLEPTNIIKNQNNCKCEEKHCTHSEQNLQSYVDNLNKDLTSDDILRKIEVLRSRIRQGQTPILLVIESSAQTKVEQPKKKGFWNWFKNLFSHK